MAIFLLMLTLSHPPPVTTLGAIVNPDGSITINWTLPADPSIVGVTLFRDHWNGAADVIFEIVGISGSFTDTGGDPDRSYRYWVHTRNAAGELSVGAFVEIFGEEDSQARCQATAIPSCAPWPMLLAGLVILTLARFRCRAYPS
jgi:hypothetical protein